MAFEPVEIAPDAPLVPGTFEGVRQAALDGLEFGVLRPIPLGDPLVVDAQGQAADDAAIRTGSVFVFPVLGAHDFIQAFHHCSAGDVGQCQGFVLVGVGGSCPPLDVIRVEGGSQTGEDVLVVRCVVHDLAPFGDYR